MKKRIFIVALLVVALISGCSFMGKDPQKAVNDGFAALKDVKKMSASLVLKGVIQAPEGETPSKVEFTLKTDGKSDASNGDIPLSDSSIEIDFDADGQTGSAKAMVKIVDGKLFFNLNSLQLGGELGTQIQGQMAPILAKWWSMALDAEGSPFKGFTDEQKKLQEKFSEIRFFVNAAEDGNEDIGGVSMTKYRVELDKTALKTFLVEIAKSGGTEMKPEEEVALQDSLKDVEFSGFVYVSDGAVHALKGTVTVRPAQGANISFDFDYRLADFGKDVVVTAPADAEEFNPLMIFGLMGAMGGAGADVPLVDEALPAPTVESTVPTPAQ